jgi:hypothetical protein
LRVQQLLGFGGDLQEKKREREKGRVNKGKREKKKERRKGGKIEKSYTVLKKRIAKQLKLLGKGQEIGSLALGKLAHLFFLSFFKLEDFDRLGSPSQFSADRQRPPEQ